MNWISVKDEKPPSRSTILVYDPSQIELGWAPAVFLARMDSKRPHFYDVGPENVGRMNFTHWMPLPPCPKD